MSIKFKLFFGIVVMIALIVAVGGGGVYFVSQERDALHDLHGHVIPFYSSAEQVSILMLQHRRYEKDYFLNIGKPEK